MHVFISGASGRNGAIALKEALDKGHTVTALVRNPSSLAAHPRLTVLKGSAISQSDVELALKTPQAPAAVITTINQRRTSENPFAPLSPDSPLDLLTLTTQTLLNAIAASGFSSPPKIVVNSTLGAGSSWASMNLPTRLIFRYSTMRVTLADHDNLDALVRKSGYTFVLARPARLVEGPAKKVLSFPDNGSGAAWMPTISRESVGKWLVEAAETDAWDGKSPVLTN